MEFRSCARAELQPRATTSRVLGIPLVLVIVATWFDLRRRTIPDAISLALLAWAVLGIALGYSAHGWLSLVVGAATAFALGMLLFWLGAFGGGDVKLIAALGAVLGARDLLPLLFYVAVSGGVLAAAAMLRGRRDIAYAPAIMLGLIMFVVARGLR
jgi:prepilin peptidase CpaA